MDGRGRGGGIRAVLRTYTTPRSHDPVQQRSSAAMRNAAHVRPMVAEKGIPVGGKYVGPPSGRRRSGPPSERRRSAVGPPSAGNEGINT